MQKYKVTARVAVIPSGVIAISAEQSGPRRHNLKDLGGGRFEVQKPVEFKAGSTIVVVCPYCRSAIARSACARCSRSRRACTSKASSSASARPFKAQKLARVSVVVS